MTKHVGGDSAVVFGGSALGLGDVVALAARRRAAALSDDPALHARWQRGAAVIAERVKSGAPTYGVSTGFGAASTNVVPAELAWALAANLPRYHSCGVDPLLSLEESRAVLAVRLASLVQGQSGVRPQLLERLRQLLEADIVPCIPARGSVGASGDLTPLAYVALTVTGEASVHFRGGVVPAAEALAAVGLEPLRLAPKESLAIMNGTSVMTALMCLAHGRAARLARLSAVTTAMVAEAVGGQVNHLDERIMRAKPHAGQVRAAAWMRAALGVGVHPPQRQGRIQERYSLRCAPHIIGVLLDTLAFTEGLIETELNGASDNPLVIPETGEVLHGGNFYGGHVALAADTLKNTVANLADLMERQVVLLNDPNANGGLPANLVLRANGDRLSHHGFKAMEITASALTAEALKLTMPASVFSRSTEGHNQDKTSMGTIAARDCVTIIDLCESVAAINLLAACQALDIRARKDVGAGCARLHALVRESIPPVDADRPMDSDIRAVRKMIAEERLPLVQLTGD
jgi:histidine ammonia-lyase